MSSASPGAELREREPHIVGTGAFLVRRTGITDYRRLTCKMADLFQAAGGEIRLGAEVLGLREMDGEVRVETAGGDFASRRLICCAGLMSDRLVRMLGLQADFRIVPFRGEYFRLPPGKNAMFKEMALSSRPLLVRLLLATGAAISSARLGALRE